MAELGNILDLRINKIRTDEAVPPPFNSNNMLAEDVDELLFDILRLNPVHCLAFDYNTGRNNTRQVELKPGIPVADTLVKSPLEFNEFNVVLSQQRSLLRVFLLMFQMKKSSICACHTAVLIC